PTLTVPQVQPPSLDGNGTFALVGAIAMRRAMVATMLVMTAASNAQPNALRLSVDAHAPMAMAQASQKITNVISVSLALLPSLDAQAPGRNPPQGQVPFGGFAAGRRAERAAAGTLELALTARAMKKMPTMKITHASSNGSMSLVLSN